MTEMISLFVWAILSGSAMAMALTWIGAQLTARDQGVQALVVSQGASLGAMIGMVFHEVFQGLPILLSLGGGALIALLGEKVVRPSWSGRNTYFLGAFALLLSLTYLVTALVPSLESHVTAQLFGDLAVVKESDARWLFVVILMASAFLLMTSRKVTQASFDLAMFGHLVPGKKKRVANFGFLAVALTMICLSIQFFGLLFTIGSLFMVPVFVRMESRSLTEFIFSAIVLALSGSLTGFLVSLYQGHLPTVPTILLSYFVLGCGVHLSQIFLRRRVRSHESRSR